MSVATNKSDAIESFLSGKLAQVDVQAIQNELDKLWQKASSGKDAGNHPQVIRACSCNLILFSDRTDAETVDSNMLDQVVLQNPSRAILAISRPDKDRRLEAWVTARCHLSAGSSTKQICSEQITIMAEGADDNELLSVMESLVLGDLPVFLWWTLGDISGDRIGHYLACTRHLIVDSAYASSDFEYLQNLQAIVNSAGGDISVADLNWRRLFDIRCAIAEEFERLPLSPECFQELKQVTIKTCAAAGSTQALLFAGWLASRLNWKPVSFNKNKDQDCRAEFSSGNKKIEVHFVLAATTNELSGSIVEIEIELEKGLSLTINRSLAKEANNLSVSVKQSGKSVREFVVDDTSGDQAKLVGDELNAVVCDNVFVQSLEMVNKLISYKAK
ncbi:MAG: glucose-6-phosphate dehydrogenase assembly protein OpcA [Candidatus Obscuribacterales bacterium]|jgi:glucose-6-phosphate dehydrogenase assembly protein OpcA|nr:glucose-6-phosphate dehydrogenase assembly protein OpcA [Candidatus Obscuribacterales bacterium]